MSFRPSEFGDVSTRPLPTPKAGYANPEAFGAGLGRGLSQVGQVAAAVYEKKRDDAEAARLTQLIREYGDYYLSLRDADNNGPLSRQGHNARGSEEEVRQGFDDWRGRQMANLASERLKRMADQWLTQQRASLLLDAARHERNEGRKADRQETLSSANNALRMGADHYQDSERVTKEESNGRAVIASYLHRTGAGPEKIKEALALFESQFHVGVLDRFIEARDAEGATARLEEYGDKMTPAARQEVKGRADQMVFEVDSAELALRFIEGHATSKDSRGAALQDAAKIGRPALRGRVSDLIRDYHDQLEADRKDAEESIRQTAEQAFIAAGYKTAAIPRGVWNSLPLSRRTTFWAAESSANSRGEPEMTAETAREWRNYKLLPDHRKLEVDLFGEFFGRLPLSDWQGLVREKAAIQEARTGVPEHTSILTTAKVMTAAVKEANLDGRAAFEFAKLLETEVQSFESKHYDGRTKATVEEISTIAERLLLRGYVSESFMGIDWLNPDTQKRTFQALPGEELQYDLDDVDVPLDDQQRLMKQLYDAGYKPSEEAIQASYLRELADAARAANEPSEIPPTDRDQIIKALAAAGERPTAKRILELYRAQQAREQR